MNLYATTLFLCCVFFTNQVSAAAQYEFDDNLLSKYKRAVENTFELIQEKARPFLSGDQRELLDRTVLRVEMDNWDVRATSVDSGANQPTIVIPIGIIVLQDHLDTAVVVAELAKINRSILIDYVTEFSRIVRLNDERSDRGLAPVGLPQFPVYSRLSGNRFRQILESRDFETYKDLVKVSSFAFLILHEFAHLYWPNERINTKEVSADLFAARIATQADMSPLFAQMTFYFFAAMEGDQGLDEPLPNYPSPICRGVHFLHAGIAQAEKDSAFIEYMKREGLWSEWVRSLKDLENMLTNDISCPDLFKLKKTGVPAPTRPSKRRYRLIIQTPTPGLCNGTAMNVSIDGRPAFLINNTQDSSPTELDSVGPGLHRFKLSKITTYCIRPESPYRMKKQSTGGECEGTFEAGETNDLQLFVASKPLVGIECGIF